MDLNARDARMALGSDQVMVPGAVANVLQMFRYYLAPDAPDLAYQNAARFLRFRRTAQLRGDYLVKFDLPRRTAESPAQMGGAFPESFVPVLRLQDAFLRQAEDSAALASAQGTSGIAQVAGQKRRLFGPIGSSRR